jgi:extradiol dioxygenase family protein
MSIEGVTFCDLCGGVVGRDDIAPVRVDEGGHQVQLHLHNRHTNDCLAKMLIQMMDQYASGVLAPAGNGSTEKSAQYDA